MKTDVQIDFQILGSSIPPAEISRLTDIKPDVELMQGGRNKERNIPRTSIWALRSKSSSDEVSEHWRELEGKIGKARHVIKEIAQFGVAKFTLIVNSDQRIPPITIPSSMSEFAGFIGAVIDIDHMQ